MSRTSAFECRVSVAMFAMSRAAAAEWPEMNYSAN